MILSIRSMPPPFEVVTYRAPSGPSIGVRSRPKAPSSSSGTISLTRVPFEVNSKTRSDESFSEATTSRPSQLPHQSPSRKTAPLVASVFRPDDHLASLACGNLWRSVIGTFS